MSFSARPRRRFHIVANRTAGRAGSPVLAGLLEALAQLDADAKVPALASADAARAHVAEVARSAACDAVVAVGGDGTLRQVAAGALGTGLPVAFVPDGTGNVMGHELGLPRSPRELAEILIGGPTTDLHAGLANREPFFLMAGAGIDGAIIGRLDSSLKHRIGKAAFAGPTLAALARPLDRIEAIVDGARHVATWAVVANAMHYGGAFRLAPETHALRPGLIALLFTARSRAGLAGQLLALATGRLARRRDVVRLTCRKVSIDAQAAVPVQIDGDAFGTTPLTVEACEATVRLIVPPRWAAEEAGSAGLHQP